MILRLQAMWDSKFKPKRCTKEEPPPPAPPSYHPSQNVLIPAGCKNVTELPRETIIKLAQASFDAALAGACNRQHIVFVHSGEEIDWVEKLLTLPKQARVVSCSKCKRCLRATDRTEGFGTSCKTWNDFNETSRPPTTRIKVGENHIVIAQEVPEDIPF